MAKLIVSFRSFSDIYMNCLNMKDRERNGDRMDKEREEVVGGE